MVASLTELFHTPGGRGWVKDALKEIGQHSESYSKFWHELCDLYLAANRFKERQKQQKTGRSGGL